MISLTELRTVANTISRAAAFGWTSSDRFVKRRLVQTLFLVIGTASLAGMAPVALKSAIDGFNFGLRASIETQPVTDPSSSLFYPVLLIGLYVIAMWVSRSLGELRWYFFGTADQRLHRNLSLRLFQHVIDLPMAFHVDRKTGAINQTLVQGLAGYRILTNHAVFTVLPVFFEITIVTIILAFYFKAEYAGILLATVFAYVLAFSWGAARIVRPIREVSTTQLNATASLTDSILNAETIKSFNAEQRVTDRYDETLSRSEYWWSIFYWRKSENGLLIALIFAISLGTALSLGVFQVRTGAMSIGEFVMVNAYLLQLVRPLETLGLAIRDMAHGAAFIEKMTDLLGRETEGARLKLMAHADEHLVPAGRLEARNVSFSYEPGRPILNNINFAIEPGMTVGIVGKSGAGKSSIVRLLMRYFDPSRGELILDGKSIHDLPITALRRSIAVVPQDTILLDDTIAFNIGFGCHGASQEEIAGAAKTAQIHERIMAMPKGYATVVGERGVKLSGGERQRISIARAVLKNPKVFLFDEPTSSLDTETEKAICSSIKTISAKATTLIISHRLALVAHADEIIVIDGGNIVERGTHEALLAKNGMYAAMGRPQEENSNQEAREGALMAG